MRLVLDTCILVAAIRSPKGASIELVKLALSRNLETVMTVALYYEYEDVLSRPEHHVGGWSVRDSAVLINQLLFHAKQVEPYFSYRPTLRDEGDELVLEAAVNGRADIVTFNLRDFEPASRFGIRALRPGEALQEIYKGGFSYGKE